MRVVVFAALVVMLASPAAADERYALLVTGATGGPAYAEQYARWIEDLSDVLVDRMKLDKGRVRVLAEGRPGPDAATAGAVRQAFSDLKRRMKRDDLLFVVLIGHGTFDGVDAKFNLVGPDLSSAEWATLLGDVPGRVVLVNTASASFPFVEGVAGPRRIVISATDTAAQRFDTVFPEYFIRAFRDDAGDIDKNGRISVWEAFAAAADGVRRHYQQRGQLATERPLLDDNGDGVGHEAAGQSDDGSVSSHTYLDIPLPGAAPTDEVMLQLLQKRAAIEAEVEELKIRKAFLSSAEYDKEFERLMIDLARVNRDIRNRTKS